MNHVLSRLRPAWQRTKLIVVLALVLWALVVCFQSLTQVQIDSVSFNGHSEWNERFLSESGFSTISISSHVSSRQYTDHISIVGNHRSRAWFEQLGFEDIEELRSVVRTITQTLPGEESVQQGLVMRHPMLPHKIFYYLSATGILIYQEP